MLWFNFKGRNKPFDLTNKTSFPIDAKIAKKPVNNNDNYDFNPINRVITCYTTYTHIYS